MTTIRLNSGFDMPLTGGIGTFQPNPGPGDITAAIKAAVSVGYRHIDTAYVYGTETEIGAALSEIFSSGTVRRADLFIVTKLWCTAHHPDDVKLQLEESLSRLGIDYLDLYLMHYPFAYKRSRTDLTPKDEKGNVIFEDIHYVQTWKAMEACVDEGLLRSIGLSNFNSEQIQDVIDNSRIKPAVLQIELHPYFQQQKLVDFCRHRNIVVTSYSSFGSPGWPVRIHQDLSILSDETLLSLGKKHGKTPAQIILRWLFQLHVVSIPKSVTPARIKENFEVFDFQLSSDDMETIKKLDKNVRLMWFYEERDGKLEMMYKDAPYFPYNAEF